MASGYRVKPTSSYRIVYRSVKRHIDVIGLALMKETSSHTVC